MLELPVLQIVCTSDLKDLSVHGLLGLLYCSV